MDIVKRLRDYADGLSGYAADMMGEAANEIEHLREYKELLMQHCNNKSNETDAMRKALRMWVKFWEADNSIDVGGDALLAEEAMEFTRELLGDNNV